MKHFFKKIIFSFLLIFIYPLECTASGLGIADAFKDLSEAELMKAIEESQKALEDLMTNGTPEQKAEFEKALTELAENLSPEDWKELQAIGEVYEKNNPQIPQEAPKEKPAPVAEKKPEAKAIPEKTKVSQFEASLKETLELIIKNIDHMFHILSSHRDLSHKLKLWEEKSSFEELKSLLIRLKKHVNRLAKATEPENKAIIDNLNAFKKDLEAENKRITLAQDDFGLENPMTSQQADHTLTRITLVLSTGVNNLLPSLTEFFKKYEPEALEEAKKKDAQKAKAKEHEKSASQRRPSSPYFSTAPSRTGGYDSYNHMPQRRYRPSDMQNGFYQGGQGNASQNTSQKEHKADFGGFDMNIKKGTIVNGKAVQNPEKKKDKKDGDKDEEQETPGKKSDPSKSDRTQSFIKALSDSMTKVLQPSTFTRDLQVCAYPLFKSAQPINSINDKAINDAICKAIIHNFEKQNTRKLKQDIATALKLSVADFTSPNLEDIIKNQNDAIFACIEPLCSAQKDGGSEDTSDDSVDTNAQKAQAILINDDVKASIANAIHALSIEKDMQSKNADSAQKIEILNKFYTQTMYSQLAKHGSEIDEIELILNRLQSSMVEIPQADLAKFIKSKTFTDFETRVQTYEKEVQAFKANAEKQYATNIKLIMPGFTDQYLKTHQAICDLPKGLASKIINAKNTISALKQNAKIPYLTK